MQLLIQSEKIKKAKLHSKKSLKSISSNRKKNKPRKMPKSKTPIMLNHLQTAIRITLLIITVVAITIQIILSLMITAIITIQQLHQVLANMYGHAQDSII